MGLETIIVVGLGYLLIRQLCFDRSDPIYQKKNKRQYVQNSVNGGLVNYEYSGQTHNDTGYLGIPREYHAGPHGVKTKMYGDNDKNLYRLRKGYQSNV